MAMVSNLGDPRSSSYGVTYRTVKLTLGEALRDVISGKMNAMDLFTQLSPKVCSQIDKYCSEVFGKDFIYLDFNDKKQVMQKLLDEYESPKPKTTEATSKKMTIPDAIKETVNGNISIENLMKGMPGEVRTRIERASMQLTNKSFNDLSSDKQIDFLKLLLESMSKNNKAG